MKKHILLVAAVTALASGAAFADVDNTNTTTPGSSYPPISSTTTNPSAISTTVPADPSCAASNPCVAGNNPCTANNPCGAVNPCSVNS